MTSARRRTSGVTVAQRPRHRAHVQTRRTSRQLQRQVQHSTEASLSLHLGCTRGPASDCSRPRAQGGRAACSRRPSHPRLYVMASGSARGRRGNITAGWIAPLFSAAASTRRPGRASRSCAATAHLSPLPIDAAQSTDLSPTHTRSFLVRHRELEVAAAPAAVPPLRTT